VDDCQKGQPVSRVTIVHYHHDYSSDTRRINVKCDWFGDES